MTSSSNGMCYDAAYVAILAHRMPESVAFETNASPVVVGARSVDEDMSTSQGGSFKMMNYMTIIRSSGTHSPPGGRITSWLHHPEASKLLRWKPDGRGQSGASRLADYLDPTGGERVWFGRWPLGQRVPNGQSATPTKSCPLSHAVGWRLG
jgi:hypothetical protein